MKDSSHSQQWTATKIICYLFYRLIAKHLPDDLGPVGKFSRWFRRVLTRPLLRESAKIITISQGVDFDNGAFLVMRDHANLGKGCSISGCGLVTIGKHVMMGTVVSRFVWKMAYPGIHGY